MKSELRCPINPDHGFLFILDGGPRPLFCSHHDHMKTKGKPIDANQYCFTWDEARNTSILTVAKTAKAHRIARRKR